MAIAYLRLSFWHLRPDRGACHQIAYFGRARIRDRRLAKTFDFARLPDDLVYEAVTLPEAAPPAWAVPAALADAMDAAETTRVRRLRDRRRWPQIGANFVLALPPDDELTLDEAVELTNRIAQAVRGSWDAPLYVAIHDPRRLRPGARTRHAHIFMALREVRKGAFARTKIRPFARVRRSAEQKSVFVAQGTDWPRLAHEVQQAYFAELGIDLVVDPPAPVGGRHWSRTSLQTEPGRRDVHEGLTRTRNLAAVSGPVEPLVGHLLRGRGVVQIAEARRLLARFLDGEDERQARLEAILGDASIVTLARNPGEARPSSMTTGAVQQVIEAVVRWVDSESGRGPAASLQVVSGTSQPEILEETARRVRDAAGGSAPVLLLGVAMSDTDALADKLGGTFSVSTFLDVLGERPWTPRSPPNRQTIVPGAIVAIARAEQVGDQMLARVLLVARDAGAAVVLGFDVTKANIVNRVAAHIADNLAPPDALTDEQIARCLRAGLIRCALTAMAQRGRLLFEAAVPVAQNVDFVVCDDTRQLRARNESFRNASEGRRAQTTIGLPGAPALSAGDWVCFFKTDYSSRYPKRHPEIRAGRLGRIIEVVPGRNVIRVEIGDGLVRNVKLDKFPSVRSAHALSIREARYAPKTASLVVELTSHRSAWAALLLAADRAGSAVARIDPAVATDVAGLIAAAAASLPAPLPSELVHCQDPDVVFSEIMRNCEPARIEAADGEAPIEIIPEPRIGDEVAPPVLADGADVRATVAPAVIEEPPPKPVGRDPRGSDFEVECMPTPPETAPTTLVIPREKLHESVRAILCANPRTRQGWASLTAALRPDAPDRVKVGEKMIALCNESGPLAVLVRLLISTPVEEALGELEESDLPRSLAESLPPSWSDWDLYVLAQDLAMIVVPHSAFYRVLRGEPLPGEATELDGSGPRPR
ncbi:MobA/MobL family protein [Rhodoplanes sp. SY1]|uniref:MobA/MobL family protein n=1 Tax=Rhodoplanes sp. SY1 TaxID=3166646 RepID=UPI0038B59526